MELKEMLRLKRRKLESAFHLIKTRVTNDVQLPIYAVSFDTFVRLVKLIDPSKTEVKIKILFRVLDFSQDNSLRNFKNLFFYLNLAFSNLINISIIKEKSEFLYVSELLGFRLSERKDRENMFEKYIPKIYKCTPSKVLKVIVGHRY